MKGTVRRRRTLGGTWSFRIDVGLDDRGWRRQSEVGGLRTKKDAQAALNDALSGPQRGTYVAPSRTTVRQLLDTRLVDEQVAAVGPGRAQRQPFLPLAVEVSLERGHRRRSEQ